MIGTMIEAALAAGAEIARIYVKGCDAEIKADGSPVTIADRAAERIILDRLAAAFPDIPVLAEEEACAGRIPRLGRRFFLVDPLDGTRGFVARNGEFTVNIALIEDGRPVAGVVQAPASGDLYWGSWQGAFRRISDGPDESIHARRGEDGRLVAVGSRDYPGAESLAAELGIAEFRRAGSSLKFCLIAAGEADVYPRHGPTMEWDTAAGQAVLEAAGGRVMALDGGREAGPLRYGREEAGFVNPHFIAWGA